MPPSSTSRRLIIPLAVISLLLGGTWFAWKGFFSHFLFIFCYLFAVSMFLSLRLPRYRPFLYNLSFVFLALFLFEGYLNLKAFTSGTIQSGNYSGGGYFTADPVRGFGAPLRQATYKSTKRRKTGELIYDVTYTIGADGLRVTPVRAERADHPAWFFGCSFTIGEGVNDDQTLPSAYSISSGVQALNFGFHGYGPHQMLRMLETGYAKDIDPRSPSVIFYNAISVHVERSAGLVSWDKDGPKYSLAGDGVAYTGRFSDGALLARYLDKILDRSLIYQQVIRPRVFARVDADMDRYLGIVKRSADFARDKYSSRLVVVLWDVFGDRSPASDVDSDVIATELAKRGVPVIRVSEALGREDYKKYYIEGDGHPLPAGYAKVAELLARQIQPVHSMRSH